MSSGPALHGPESRFPLLSPLPNVLVRDSAHSNPRVNDKASLHNNGSRGPTWEWRSVPESHEVLECSSERMVKTHNVFNGTKSRAEVPFPVDGLMVTICVSFDRAGPLCRGLEGIDIH